MRSDACRPGDRDQPERGAYPSLGTTLLRSLLIGSSRSRDEHLAAGIIDLYLELDLRDIPLLDFGLVESAAAAGREQAQDLIAEWLADRGRLAMGSPRQRARARRAARRVAKERLTCC